MLDKPIYFLPTNLKKFLYADYIFIQDFWVAIGKHFNFFIFSNFSNFQIFSYSSTLRFKLRDLDGISGGQDRFATDFKVVVNFRPEKELKSIPLRCKNADLALLFGTRDEMVNNREMMGSSNNSNAGTPSPTSAASPQVDNVPSPLFEDQLQHPKAPPR